MTELRFLIHCLRYLPFVCLLLLACTDREQQSTVTTPTLPEAVRTALYKASPGPFAVRSSGPQILASTGSGRDLDYVLLSPQLGDATVSRQFPLLLFSHGYWSDNLQYDALLHHWVSHGYVVVAPFHVDGGGIVRGLFNSYRFGNMGLIEARSQDLKTILDRLDEVLAVEPGLGQRVDRDRIAASGHSFGAFSAQQMSGAAALDTETGVFIDVSDPRISAVVAISPPGEMFDEIVTASWQRFRGPALATTGTADLDGYFVTDWRQHLLSWETAPPEQQYALVLQGADHYLGKLICRTGRDAVPQHDALQVLRSVTLQFLDTHLAADPPGNRLDPQALSELLSEVAQFKIR